jgi:predicted phage terminase large subunit-like protein
MHDLSLDEIEELTRHNADLTKLTVPRVNAFIPHNPMKNPKQAAFLLLDNLEALYGGSAGGGKSDALLMSALQYVDEPKYAALLLRRTFADLALPGALMDRAHDWLNGKAKWHDKEKTWEFPKGATLTFGYLEHEMDKYRYQSAEFQFIGFDELTQFLELQYRFLFSRLRRLAGSKIPVRMRAASNPGNIGHEWVKQRFIEERKKAGRIFIPASLVDNPFVDVEAYKKALDKLDYITREQLLSGVWDITNTDGKFKRSWFEIVDDFPSDAQFVRYWDLAATTPKQSAGGRMTDPDYTVGALLCEQKGVFTIVDIRRFRARPKEVEENIKQTANEDGKSVPIYMEQEPGSAGVNTIDHYAREVLKGFDFRGNRATGSKELRANPVSSAAEHGNVKLMRGPWITTFLDEAEIFPKGTHDDQVDAVSGGFEILSEGRGTIAVGFGTIHHNVRDGLVSARHMVDPRGIEVN